MGRRLLSEGQERQLLSVLSRYDGQGHTLSPALAQAAWVCGESTVRTAVLTDTWVTAPARTCWLRACKMGELQPLIASAAPEAAARHAAAEFGRRQGPATGCTRTTAWEPPPSC